MIRNFYLGLICFISSPALAAGPLVTVGGTSVTIPVPQAQGGTSISPLQLPNWRKALAAIRHGTTIVHPRIIVGTDSTIAGGSGTGGTNIVNLTYYLAKCLQANGVQANNNGVMGLGPYYSGNGYSFNRLTTDSRFTAGSWAQNSSYSGLGGNEATSTAAGSPLVYAPASGSPNANPVDTFQVFYPSWLFLSSARYGNFTVTATGGTAQIANGGTGVGPGDTPTLKTVTATAALASVSNTVSINWTANGSAGASTPPIFLGVDAYNRGVSSVQIFNTGVSGAVFAQWSSPLGYAFDPLPSIEYLAPVLTIIEFGPNDLSAGTTVAALRGQLQTAIAGAKTVGDVMLMTWTPDLRNPAVTQAYISMAKSLAAQDGLPLYDLNARWGSEARSASRGYMVDSDHPNSVGYANQANGLCRMLLGQ